MIFDFVRIIFLMRNQTILYLLVYIRKNISVTKFQSFIKEKVNKGTICKN